MTLTEPTCSSPGEWDSFASCHLKIEPKTICHFTQSNLSLYHKAWSRAETFLDTTQESRHLWALKTRLLKGWFPDRQPQRPLGTSQKGTFPSSTYSLESLGCGTRRPACNQPSRGFRAGPGLRPMVFQVTFHLLMETYSPVCCPHGGWGWDLIFLIWKHGTTSIKQCLFFHRGILQVENFPGFFQKPQRYFT